MPTILMPALSPTMEEGKLAKWLKNVGDTVKPGDIIAEIETDKATMEVEAVDEGPLTAILIPAGTEGVKVNTPIAVIGEADAAAPPPAQAPGTRPMRQPTATPSPTPVARPLSPP
jgi:pyruvate dehydrogenase E1 component beta subunit